MSLVNESQLLVRNIEDLSGLTPLFVNFPADGFITEYLAVNANTKISCYNTNYEQYLSLQNYNASLSGQAVSYDFCTHYQTDTKHDIIIIQFPKSKAELAFTLSMLHSYITDDVKVYVVGNNKSGIKSIEKLTKDLFSYCTKIDSARHCSIYSCGYQDNIAKFQLDEWFQNYQFTIANQEIRVTSLPGVFSQKHLDKGTELLLNNLPENMSGKVLDFGCGAGVISSFIGKCFPSVSLSLVDVSALALTSAERTLQANGLTGELIASNSLSHVEDSYEHIVSNPPFHQGIKTSYEATETFLGKIKQHINKKGCITIVANSFLQYQSIMEKSIGSTKRLSTKSGFTIYYCQKK